MLVLVGVIVGLVVRLFTGVTFISWCSNRSWFAIRCRCLVGGKTMVWPDVSRGTTGCTRVRFAF